MSKARKPAQKPNQAKNEAAVTGTSVAVRESTTLATPLPEGVKLVRRLQLPSLVMKQGETRYLHIANTIRKSKVPGKKLKEAVKLEDGTVKTHEDPADICMVGDVLTGEAFTWLVPAVVKSTLVQEKPDGAADDWYIDHTFVVENLGKREGKRHIDYMVAEVDASGLRAA